MVFFLVYIISVLVFRKKVRSSHNRCVSRRYFCLKNNLPIYKGNPLCMLVKKTQTTNGFETSFIHNLRHFVNRKKVKSSHGIMHWTYSNAVKTVLPRIEDTF